MRSSIRVPEGDFLLLVTEEDCQIETVLPHPPRAHLGVLAKQSLGVSPLVQSFAVGAIEASCGALVDMGSAWSDQIVDAVSAAGTKTVVTGYAPVGSVADQLAALNLRGADITLHQIRRAYDTLAWPYATKGFFGLLHCKRFLSIFAVIFVSTVVCPACLCFGIASTGPDEFRERGSNRLIDLRGPLPLPECPCSWLT